MDNFDDGRYSVCIVHVDNYNENAYYKYFRVADYAPQDNPDELIPAIVQKHTTSLEEARANPDYLYNPSAARNHEYRESDFYLFQWWQDPNDWEKQLTRSSFDDRSLGVFKEAREVILLENLKSERGLRNALSEGIPFEGKTTSIFYIVYGDKNENGLCPAIRCERRDFSFNDGRIRLRDDISNVRKTILSAPRVWLEDNDIIESPHMLTSYRKLYAKLDEPRTDSNVLLRPLSYYASDYVKWFIREESIQVSKSDRRTISQIIDSAFSRPDVLRAYLEAETQEDEVQSLKESIAYIVMGKEDPDREIFRKALLEDKSFYQECVEQVTKMSNPILDERKKELAAAKSNIEQAQSFLNGLNSDIDILKQKKQSLESDIEGLSSDLEKVRKEQDEVLAEIQSNIALKIGLRTAATQLPGSPAPGLMIEEGLPCDCVESNSGFEEVLLNNLKQIGVTSAVVRPADERKRLVAGLIGALAATKIVAIPQTIARQVADSISIAMSGHSAKRVIVPADYRDVTSVLEAISGEDGVVVIEGVVDAVNEGVLFALLSKNVKPVVVLSFMSHASISLIAKEVWGKIFLPNVESLLVYSHSSKEARLQRAVSEPMFPNVSVDDALEEARDLSGELEQLNLAAESLLLAATVFCAVEDLIDEDSIERYVAQHLLICSRCDEQSFQVVNRWSEEDPGLLELAKKLGVYEL